MFNELAAGRPWLIGMSGQSPLPITAGARMDIAMEQGWDPGTEAYDEFLHYMRALDQEWLEDHTKRTKTRTPKR